MNVIAKAAIDIAATVAVVKTVEVSRDALRKRRMRKTLEKIFEGFTLEEIQDIANSDVPTKYAAQAYLQQHAKR